MNASPEPFSNWALSLGEDGVAIFLSWLAVSHPVVTFAIVVGLVASAVGMTVLLFRYLKRLFRRGPVPLQHSPRPPS